MSTHSVSYSEVKSWLSCTRKWEYGYGRSLKPLGSSHGLAMGSAGHAVLEAYYQTVLDAGDTRTAQRAAHDEGVAAARAEFDKQRAAGYEDTPSKAPLEEILFDFYFPNEPFVSTDHQVMAVETEYSFDTEVNDDLTVRVPLRADLIVEDPSGVYVVIDHKFLGEFITPETARLEPQIPLYLGGLRALNYPIGYGAYNMLRTRKIKTPTPAQRHHLMLVKPNSTRVARQVLDHIATAEEVLAFGSLSHDERDAAAKRTVSSMECRFCQFQPLCAEELEGGNVKLMLATEYEMRYRKTPTPETIEHSNNKESI